MMTNATNPAPAVTATRERRRHQRLVCKGEANVRVPNVEAHATGIVTNLSVSGCYIEFAAPFNITYGQRLDILFNINQLPFRVMGCTRIVHPKKGIGVEFTDISRRGSLQLQELISELCSATASCTPQVSEAPPSAPTPPTVPS
jgi:hypothetical protein